MNQFSEVIQDRLRKVSRPGDVSVYPWIFFAHYEAMLIQFCPRANVLQNLGRDEEAIVHFEETLRLAPNLVEALNNLAWLLASSAHAELRNGPRAVELAQRACELTGFKETLLVGTLAAAYAEAGRFPEAIATAEKACALASDLGQKVLLKKNEELLELYHSQKPYHETLNDETTWKSRE